MSITEIEAAKAKNLRYKKPIVKHLNLDEISEAIYEMQGDCADVQWFVDNEGHDALAEALGDEDDAYEFKMQFSALESDIERFLGDLDEWRGYLTDAAPYDLMMAACLGGREEMLGYDAYEEDYLPIMQGDEYAAREAQRKIERLTKKQMMEAFTAALSVTANYCAIKYRYDCLKTSMEILRGKNDGILQSVTAIAKAYDKAETESCGFAYDWYDSVKWLDKLAQALPDAAWIQ